MTYNFSSGHKTKAVDEKSYQIGVPIKVYVGEQIISRKSYFVESRTDFLKASRDFNLSGGFGLASVKLFASAGDLFKIMGNNEKGNLVVLIPGSHLMFGVSDDEKWDSTIMSSNFLTSPIGSGNYYTMTPDDVEFQKTTTETPSMKNGYVNHELIYTGLGGDGIRVLYREYTFENMARGDFSQELVYPSDAKEIRFRQYVIKVNRVSPSEMDFTVLSE